MALIPPRRASNQTPRGPGTGLRPTAGTPSTCRVVQLARLSRSSCRPSPRVPDGARGARDVRGRRVFSELPPAPGVCSRVILRRFTAVALHLLAVGPAAQAQADSTRAADRLA